MCCWLCTSASGANRQCRGHIWIDIQLYASAKLRILKIMVCVVTFVLNDTLSLYNVSWIHFLCVMLLLPGYLISSVQTVSYENGISLSPFLFPHTRVQTAALNWFANSLQCCHIKIGWTQSTSPGTIYRWTRVPPQRSLLFTPDQARFLAATRVCVRLLTSAERLHDPACQRGFTDWRSARPQAD